MIFKTVVINVTCFTKPCTLTIMSDKGNFIKEVALKLFNTKICICTNEQRLKLIARFKSQDIYKTIYLNNQQCQNIFVNFLINKISSQRIIREIKLLVASYSLPVEKAILNFKKV